MLTLSRSRRMLIVHWDGAGNLPPHRALTRELIRRGHDVHVLSHDSTATSVAADGAKFHRLATAHQYKALDRLAPEAETAFYTAKIWGSPAYAADFFAVMDRVRPDICLVDAMLVSVLTVCVDLPIPCAALFHTAYEPIRFDPHFTSIAPRSGGKLTYSALLESFPLVLVASYEAFSPLKTFAPCVHHVGPIREPVSVPAWPRRYSDRPLILVSLSTSSQRQHTTLQRICDALALLPNEALVTTGPAVAAADLSTSASTEVRSFVPHDQVLPFVDLLITHAGHGTVMAGAGAGIPMLCMPMGRDQPLVASRVEALGLGRTLAPDAPIIEISKTVSGMLDDLRLGIASRSFAASVDRFGDLMGAADLIEILSNPSGTLSLQN